MVLSGRLLLIAVLCLQGCLLVFSQNSIKMRSNPSGCIGGEVCVFQPTVAVYNFLGNVFVTYVGSVSVVMGTSPSGFEPLYKRQCDYSGCGAPVTGVMASAPFINGIASFSNLTIRTAGTGYTLRFTGRDSLGNGFFSTTSAAFVVSTGAVYKTQFYTFLGRTLGGQEFSPQPVIAVADRGGNVISDISGYSVVASLIGPTGTEKLYPERYLTSSFSRGLAQFIKLYINEAGFPYVIKFTTTLGNIYIPPLYSASFEVGIGSPAGLVFVGGTTIDSSTIRAGEFFEVTPRLKIVDKGGNLVRIDSSSGVRAYIANNPSNGEILPAENLFQVAKFGIVSFTGLRISLIGKGYVLGFDLYTYSSLQNDYFLTSPAVTAVTATFEVVYGPPRKLHISTLAARASAGGQAFPVQPVVQIRDYGGNAVGSDFSSSITASIIPSLSASKAVRIEASQVVVSTITSVSVETPSGYYGVGESIIFYVTFLYEVWVDLSVSGARPYLTLTAISNTSEAKRAYLYGGYTRMQTLAFEYLVNPGDSAAVLDYVDRNSLVLNGATMRAGNNNAVNKLLPATGISASRTIVIETSAPYVRWVNTTTVSGEYGAGQKIELAVKFNFPVAVQDFPIIVLNIERPAGQGFYLPSNLTQAYAYANYSHMSDEYTPVFVYQVLPLDNVAQLSFHSSIMFLTPNSWIRRLATNSVLNVNGSLFAAVYTFKRASAIVIDTNAPKLNTTFGVVTTHASGTFYPGEVFYIYIKFDKEVIINGIDIVLLLECGTLASSTPCSATLERLLPDKKTVEFMFKSPLSVNTTGLDILSGGAALQIPKTPYYIRRRSTVPTTDVDANTTAVQAVRNSLADNSVLNLYGFVPIVKGSSIVTIKSSVNTSVIYPDDYVVVSVRFTTKVVFSCNPVLIIAAGINREAVYVSGNTSKVIYFKYTVGLGDSARSLFYRFSPNALCLESGCPKTTSCTMFAHSTVPILKAEFAMPLDNGLRSTGIPVGLNNSIVIKPNPIGRNTSVVKIEYITNSGTYGAGTIIKMQVTFTDDIIFQTTTGLSSPGLYLNVGKYANYSGGSGTKVLSFFYVLQAEDSTNNFAVTVNPSTGSALNCAAAQSCFLYNRNNQLVIPYSPSSVIESSSIKVDTAQPKVLDIWSDKPTSPYDGRYTIGEVINIYVTFDKPVAVVGVPPRIAMNTTNLVSGVQYAIFSSLDTNRTLLTFKYTVVYGDFSLHLTYLYDYIDINSGSTIIYRAGDVPITIADYTLPPVGTSLSKNGEAIELRTRVAPSVVEVYAVSPSKRYMTGDKVVIALRWSQYVTSTGAPYINLNLGDHIVRATFLNNYTAGVNGTGYPTKPAKIMYFGFQVSYLDFSFDLDYTDSFALNAGLTPTGNPGVIYAAATIPTERVIMDLARPGTAGSLSYAANIYIDGLKTFQTSLEILNPSGTYGVGSLIYIRMNFSAAVIVTGNPEIQMETGDFDRVAEYVRGSGTSSLEFMLQPQPGDFSAQLDYIISRPKLSSGADSFHLNGQILTASASPSLPVEIFLNPIQGLLGGSQKIDVAGGIGIFRDLSINIRGPDYRLRFISSPTDAHNTISIFQSLFVSFSNQFDLVPTEGQPGDLVGQAVATNGDIVAVGAPNSNVSVTTIQTVTTTGALSVPIPEVQVVRSLITAQPAIQRFYSTADIGAEVGGYFRVTYGTMGTTRALPVNANSDMINVVFYQDLRNLGNVTATREPYIFCACDNAFSWTITFHDMLTGDFLPLQFDSSKMTGSGAHIVGPSIVQNPAKLSGTFSLKAFGLQSRQLPIDATVLQIKAAMSDLNMGVIDVSLSATDASLARSWAITFDAYNDFYDVPLLEADYSKLRGGDAIVVVQETRKGVHSPKGLGGYFTLTWRGNTTVPLLPNTTALQMKAALEALPVINTVDVNRSLASDINGYTWTIEFVEVRTNTPRGYVVDVTKNCEPIEPQNHLIGTNTSINVGAVWSIGKPLSFFDAFRQGTYGQKAGSVYMFQNTGDKYVQVATVRGNDTNENDQFGYSVGMDGDMMIVGAVSADKNGVLEKQSIFCSATSGSFKLKFRGWVSNEIPHSATAVDLYNAIVADPKSFAKLHNIINIYIDDWGEGPLCANKTAVITFFSPVDGAPNLFPTDTGSDLEQLQIVESTLVYANNVGGVAQVHDVQDGTIRVHGLFADRQQIGSAYIFKASYHCNANVTTCFKSKWVQQAQFFPLLAADEPAKFGYSVAIHGNISVVGAPGEGSGAVYVYSYDSTTGRWGYFQRLTVAELLAGDSLGYSVAVYGNTIITGAPYFNNDAGTSYVFKRPPSGGFFSQAQTLFPSKLTYPLSAGNLFGISVSLHKDTTVVGSAGRDIATIYRGVEPDSTAPISNGAVFVFTRLGEVFDYTFYEILTPSNVKNYDRFGWSVAVHEDFIVASSVQEYTGKAMANKVIMEVKTSANYNTQRLGGYFNLEWIYTNVTTGVWRTARTKDIPYDASAPLMKTILERDLYTGDLLVSRSDRDVYDNGFVWSITFMDFSEQLAPLKGSPELLLGFNATITVTVVNPYPIFLRGKAHVFQRTVEYPHFVEQAFLAPSFHQPADRCGWHVALHGDTVAVGCPNRDSIVPNRNSGAALTYSLSLLHIAFESYDNVVEEGSSVSLSIKRAQSVVSDVDVLFYISTVDRNAGSVMQSFLKDLYGVVSADIPYPSTVADFVGMAGAAIARAQYYGSTHNESVWVDGMYDYRAISDYVPIDEPRVFLIESVTINQTIITSSDSILEVPDENITVAINSPGIWPSLLGNLQTSITIKNNGDGYSSGFQYEKFYENDCELNGQLGGAVAVHQGLGVMFASSPHGRHVSYTDLGVAIIVTEVGFVIHYSMVDGVWKEVEKIFSPNYCVDCHFGDEVKVGQIGRRNESILAVGEPGSSKVHVYISEGLEFGKTWTLEKSISVSDAFLSSHMFGASGAIALNNNVLVVGAAGIESVFIFYRLFNVDTDSWYWSDGQLIRSSDYDFDIIDGVKQVHRQWFGKSVAMSGRSIAIGSPFADYSKLGTYLVEVNWDTEGTDIFGYGRGRAYVYTSMGPVHTVDLFCDSQPSAGTFRLRYIAGGVAEYTEQIPFSASNGTIAEAVEALYYLDGIVVSKEAALIPGSANYKITWSITFLNEWQEPVPFEAIWNNHGCAECIPFSSPYSIDVDRQVVVTSVTPMSELVEVSSLGAFDKASGSRFGWSVAIDGNQLLVGSIFSPNIVSTSWDFETGQLVGWSKTGTAFTFQPTFGDNSYLRPVYSTEKNNGLLREGQRSGLVGKYFIGTFEMRPGSKTDWRVPDNTYPQGNIQGDEPVGTLTSDVFIILGKTISFLIGGGCDYNTIYVELIVDGLSVQKHTGECSEKMTWKSFDLTYYSQRAAQIRIVDDSRSNWGHINVDEFRFDWDINGGRLNLENGKTYTGGKIETPRSGAVYGFLRHLKGSVELCRSDTSFCEWTQEIKLTASDKRPNMMFGASVAINDEYGLAAIGAPGAECSGFYKELPSVHPHTDSDGVSDAAGLKFPLDPQTNMARMESIPLFAPQSSGAGGVWQSRITKGVNPDFRPSVRCGAVYIYLRKPPLFGPQGEVSLQQLWTNTETARLQAPDLSAEDTFGETIAMSGTLLAVGATGQDGIIDGGGALYAYNTAFASLYFSVHEFVALQGTDQFATVTIKRKLDVYSGPVVIDYATSDLTALGVDSYKYQACLRLSPGERGPARCGDYEQTRGTMVIPTGANSGGFTVNIVSYLCSRPYLKFFQVTLSVPGSAGLQGETLSVKVRIDDNNYLYSKCNTLYPIY